MTSLDIGVAESGSGAVGNSLQLAGTGLVYEDFSWQPEASNTFGAVNSGQTFATPPPPEVCGDPYTPVYSVQGAGLVSPLEGTSVAVEGVVVGDFQNNSSTDHGDLNGFYVQDPAGDGNPATSDGIFVFAPSALDVAVGDVVRVRGGVSEFNGMTEIGASKVLWCSGGGSVLPVAVSLPVSSLNDFEAYEGMLVNFPQALTISEYFNYDRFGEMVLALPLDGETRAFTPTAIDDPGADALARAAANALRRITLDDGLTTQNPSVVRHPNGSSFSLGNLFRGGDTVANVTGVIDYSFNLYRIQPTGAAEYTAVNPRPAAPEPVGGSLQVAALNTLNYFLTPDYPTGNPLDNKCGPLQNVECRGADSDQPNELTRQRTKLLAALAGLDADIIGLNEMENTLGVDPLGDPNLGIVPGLNDIFGPGTYTAINTGVIGTDAIRVGLIYRPAVVTPVGSFQILTSEDDPRFLDTKNRPSLAQTFEVLTTGARFTVVVNHLKSKGSDCLDVGDPDLGDGQGNCNVTRTNAAQALVDWLAADPTSSGDPDFLITGDLNSYAKEDPIDAVLAGPDDTLATTDDYTNLILQYQGTYAYSYVFDGQAGYLDHALASTSLLSQVSGATEWHINADEPDLLDYDTSFKPPSQDALYEPNGYRSSDHDAVIVGLDLNDAPDVNPISVSPNPVRVSSTVTASATFTDQGDADPHTGLWAWGDGTTSAAVINESGGSGTASGTHAYSAPGLYTVTLTVTDTDGASSQVAYQSVVVYEPGAGFFVGGGWVNSPAGAFLPDPLLEGKAEFVFDVKYQKNGTVPVGSTTLRVVDGLLFQSSSYDWLVVTGSRAQFQGTGTLNGSAGYKFQVFATDGSPDTFRMLIWYEDSAGQHIVYDSGAEQALGGGSIKHQLR
jgi:predicted extracellular nuclease